jgi:hypothetical protein
MEIKTSQTMWIENEAGDRLEIPMQLEGDTFLGTVFVSGTPYHAFIVTKDEISRGGKYTLDLDPSYNPKVSPAGSYLLISPYSE